LRDPRLDGWESEAVHEVLAGRLADLVRRFEGAAAPGGFAEFEAEGFHFEAPARWETVYEGGSFRVERSLREPRPREQSAGSGLGEALADLLRPLREAGDLHAAAKIVAIEEQAAAISTRILFHPKGDTPEGAAQLNATLRCEWVVGETVDEARIQAITVESAEVVRGPARKGPLFEDCTEAVLGANPAFREQLLPGVDHWAARLPAHLGVSILGHEGLAIGDADGDGLDDLLVCQPGGLPNRLFVRASDGTAADRSRESGLDFLDAGRSALFVDLDGDGDQDVALVAGAEILFLENDGSGKFHEAGAAAAPAASSLAAADIEGDGDLDVYVCGYWAPDAQDRTPFPYHDANNGAPNTCLRNEGRFRFVDVTREVGLDENNRRFSLAASFEDFDDDGDPDLYVANDYGRNNLYRNEGGRFVDVAAQAGVEDVGAGMGVAWGDVDGDGAMDLHVSNMFSSAGSRVTAQARFKPEADEATRAFYRRHARGNSLFMNKKDGRFFDASVEAGITVARWAWGCVLADLDRDGGEDLFVANGYVTNSDPADL
jgi:hypothetical protein